MFLHLFNFSNQAVKTEMGGWGLRFSQDLVQINARVAPPEKIMQRYDAVVSIAVDSLLS